MVSRVALFVVIIVFTAHLVGCESSRSPETCIFFDAKESQARSVRDGAKAIAGRRNLTFTDASGEHPWPDLAVYVGLEGKGFHATGRLQKGYVGTVCVYDEKSLLYGDKAKDQMKELVAEFAAFFASEKIPFETGKARPSATKSSNVETPAAPK